MFRFWETITGRQRFPKEAVEERVQMMMKTDAARSRLRAMTAERSEQLNRLMGDQLLPREARDE